MLIVEDAYLLASDLGQEVERLGAEVVGPCRSVSDAGELLTATPIDLALLDVNVADGMVYPLAEDLARRGTPFIFVTGYSLTAMPVRWAASPRLEKPFDRSALASIAETVLREQA